MPQGLILFSVNGNASYRNYVRTVKTPIRISELEIPNFSPEIIGLESISVWGVNHTAENEKIWNSLNRDDLALFYREGKFFSKGVIVHKVFDTKLPSRLWENEIHGKSWDLMIFLRDIEELELSLDVAIPFLIEPAMPSVYTFPIKRVDDSRLNLLVSCFGSIDNSIKYLVDLTLHDSVEELPIDVPEEVKLELTKRLAIQRIGQNEFRNNVIANYASKCAVCDIDESDLLQASHIIPVSNVESAGKMENGVCLCAIHHILFDKGYFSISDDYRVIISKRKVTNPTIQQLITHGKTIRQAKIPPSKRFLALHRMRFGF